MINSKLRAMLEFVAFSDRDRAALSKLHGLVANDLAQLAERTCSQIFEDPLVHKLRGSPQEAESMRRALVGWTGRFLTESFDGSFFEERSDIGRHHAQIGIPFELIPLAMNLLRNNLLRLSAERLPGDSQALLNTTLALNKLLDLELTIMLESYRKQTTLQTREEERLATVGQLAAGVSHDLKNPLGVIKTSTMLINKRLENHPNDPELGTLVDRITRSCRQAGELINQLLEFTRIKNPRSHRIPLRGLIEEAISMLDRSDAVQIELDLNPEDLTVNGDPIDLARVLANLIRNALQSIEETDAAGSVKVIAREHRDRLRIEVIDSGPGVPKELRDRVFEPLVTTRAHGTGLGLAICRELVEAHGGQLSLEPNPSGGARFAISLPRPPESVSE